MNQNLILKFLAIAGLTVVILIALYMVSGVITDRQRYREEAIHSIEASYSGPQTLVGPVLIRPYIQTTQITETNDKGGKKTVTRRSELLATSFPRDLSVQGQVVPSERRHGLYKVTVYEFAGHAQGWMDIVDPVMEGSVVWGEPYLALSVADVRGIIGTPRVKVNGVAETMLQSSATAGSWQPNLQIPVRGERGMKGRVTFDLDIDIAGTETLSIAPVGDSNHVEVSSTWASPLFAGQFLPRTREVSGSGFKAVWDVSSLASGTQMQMTSTPMKPIDLLNVSLLTPIDPYKLSDRAVKYGILFVLLTFGGFFLFEMLKQLPIHPVQYLFVGFGLALFFLLLVSFSEHIEFGFAYILASTACIGLLTFYLSFVLHSITRGLGFGAMLTTLYAVIYGLLISEDNALVLGALMLFSVLAAVMVVTRKVDWYKGQMRVQITSNAPSRTPVQTPTPPPLS